MATTTLRNTKGSPLTNTEVDNNFTNLNNDKIETSAIGSTVQAYDADLAAVAGLSSSGLITRTGAGTVAARSIAVSGTGLSVTNADGVSGNPTVTSNATSSNTNSTIVARDASGDFSAGTITATISGNVTGDLTGNADTATALATGRTISITGDMSYTSSSFTGAGNVTGTGTLATVNSNVGSFGGSTSIPVITVNGKGLVTAVSTASVSSDLDITGDSGTDTITVGTDTLDFAGGTGVTTAVTTNTVTISIDQAVSTSSDVQFDSFGVGTAASGTTGEIRATNDITAFYSSDATLKENVAVIEGAVDKVKAMRGVEFDWTESYMEERGGEDGYFVRKHDVGVIAQEMEEVLPEVVGTRENGIKAVKYDRIVAVLIEAIKEQQQQIDELKSQLAK